MLKKSLLFFFIFSLWSSRAFAQAGTAPEGEKRPKLGFAMNLSIGLSSYEDSTGTKLAFQKFGIFPELSYGKWGLGIDLSLELDGDFRLRDLDNDGHADRWTTPHDFFTRVYYLRYGQKGDPLYGRIGAFDSCTLGHGLIMDRFSNTIYYPQVIQLGLNLDMDGALFSFPYFGFETVVDDVLDWDIIGMRLYARPLAGAQNPLLKRLEFGAIFVTDLDPLENPLDVPEDNPASEGVSEYGVDVELPILERERMSLVSYADWAKIVDGGSGALVGSTFTYRWLTLLGQLRFFGKEFAPAYFDSFYEQDRGAPPPGKFASLASYDEFYVGYLVGTEMDILKAATFSFQWTDAVGDPEGPRVLTAVGTGENVIPKLDVKLLYDKRDVESFSGFFSKENSLIQLTAAYKVSAAARIVFTFERAYSPYSLTPADRTYVETQFSF